MSTPNKTAPDFGEPWTTNLDSIYDRDGPLGIFTPGYGKRIIACVNACAGMSDPAAEIEAMREAIREAWVEMQYAEARFAGWALRLAPNDPDTDSVLHKTGEAIRKLKPFLKP